MVEAILSGGCLCGSVRFEAVGELTRFYHCHCQRRRKATGTGHATNLFLQRGSLRFLTGESLTRTYKVPEAARFANDFCSQCGGRVPRQPTGTNMVMIPAGSLDDVPAMTPQARIFHGSRAEWSRSGDGTRHAGSPNKKPPAVSRRGFFLVDARRQSPGAADMRG
jgi:hypothetical protein